MSRYRVVVSANAAPGVGGQGVALANTLRAFAGAGDVTLFARAAAPGVASTIVPRPAVSRVLARTPVLRRRRDWIVLYDDVGFDRAVARALGPADLFHGTTGQCFASLDAARRLGMPTMLDVITLHVADFAAVMKRACARFGVWPPIGPVLARRTEAEYAKADLIRVMSGLARETLVARGVPAERIVTALHPMDVAAYPVARVDQAPFRVGYAGALEPWKGFEFLMDAFESLNLPDARLLLWGGASARGVTEWLAARMARNPRIRSEPYGRTPADLGRVYGSLSVLVHPSLSDGFAFVVAEAMACGVPVIVSDRTGAAELVDEGRNGYVVPAGDAGAIRDRLEHLATRPALLRELGAAARATAAGLTMERFRDAWMPRVASLIGRAGAVR